MATLELEGSSSPYKARQHVRKEYSIRRRSAKEGGGWAVVRRTPWDQDVGKPYRTKYGARQAALKAAKQ